MAIPFWRAVVQGASRGAADWGSAYIWEPRADEAWAFPGAGEAGSVKGGGKRKRTAARNRARKRGARSPARRLSEVGRAGGAGEGEEEEEGWCGDEETGCETWW